MTTPTLRLTDASVTTATVDALVVGTVCGEGGPQLLPGNEEVDAAFDGALTDLLVVLGAKGKADEVIKVPTRGAISAPLLVATGLGELDGQPSNEQVRRASGAASRALSGTSRAITTLSRIDLAAAAEGAALGCYAFTEYRSRPSTVRVTTCRRPCSSLAWSRILSTVSGQSCIRPSMR